MRERYAEWPAAVVAAAVRVRRHEFYLRGSGCVRLGERLPWHTDFKTDREWPLQYSPDIEYAELDRPTDVKVPWERVFVHRDTDMGRAQFHDTPGHTYQNYQSQIRLSMKI